jgi:L-fuconolactonase
MFIFDSHVHTSKNWFEPVETLLNEMERNGVSRALLIPFAGNPDNSYEMNCASKYPDLLRAVIQVDNENPDALSSLEEWANRGAVGVRLRAYELYPGPDPYLLWRKAEEVGLAVSCHGSLANFADSDFHDMVKSLPKLKIVLEHFGGAGKTVAFPKPEYDLLDKMLTLANYPNVYIKIHGFGEFLPRPFPFRVPPFDTCPPIIKLVYDAFGSSRMMWGSDFPPCAAREGYANALSFPMEHIPFLTQKDKEWIFGQTALSVWNKYEKQSI